MRKFSHAIVRRPCRALTEGISSGLYPGKPDYQLALVQHDAYIEALKKCGVEVDILPADERYPDSCFVEDPAVLTGRCAVITNPGAASRNGEKDEILAAVRKYYPDECIERITFPGTLEGSGRYFCNKRNRRYHRSSMGCPGQGDQQTHHQGQPQSGGDPIGKNMLDHLDYIPTPPSGIASSMKFNMVSED